jgi:hypothetical protein
VAATPQLGTPLEEFRIEWISPLKVVDAARLWS